MSTANHAWLSALFSVASRAPWVLRGVRPVALCCAPHFAPEVRAAVGDNLARLRGGPLSRGEVTRGARAVLGSFYDFVVDIAELRHAGPEAIRDRIVTITGEELYLSARAQRRGAVLLTAHLGSFEVGLAALRKFEPAGGVHVVYKADAFRAFEGMRADLRGRLGVCAHDISSPAGNPVLALRDALGRDEVVVLQADRAMPGQRSAPFRVGGGTLALPTGPFALARIHRSPLIPVFCVRGARGFELTLHPPIDPEAKDAQGQFAKILSEVLVRHAQQWLVLHRAFAGT